MPPSHRETPVIRTSRSADRVKVTFALPLEDPAGRCSVVGDFNEWIPGSHELRKRTNGTRSATVIVPRGTQLRFRYLGEHGNWFNDPDVEHCEGADNVVVV
jgi:1,4-alpha-glucan branching enzyme